MYIFERLRAIADPDPYGVAANVNIISSRRLSDLGILASLQRYHTPKATGKRVLSCICYIRYIRYILRRKRGDVTFLPYISHI